MLFYIYYAYILYLKLENFLQKIPEKVLFQALFELICAGKKKFKSSKSVSTMPLSEQERAKLIQKNKEDQARRVAERFALGKRARVSMSQTFFLSNLTCLISTDKG